MVYCNIKIILSGLLQYKDDHKWSTAIDEAAFWKCSMKKFLKSHNIYKKTPAMGSYGFYSSRHELLERLWNFLDFPEIIQSVKFPYE